jgi:hypothetical protein
MAESIGTRRPLSQALVICVVCALLALSACRVLPNFEEIFKELGLPLPRITELFLNAHHIHVDLALFALCLLCGGLAISVPGYIARRVAPVALLTTTLLLTALVVFAMFLPLIVDIEGPLGQQATEEK